MHADYLESLFVLFILIPHYIQFCFDVLLFCSQIKFVKLVLPSSIPAPCFIVKVVGTVPLLARHAEFHILNMFYHCANPFCPRFITTVKVCRAPNFITAVGNYFVLFSFITYLLNSIKHIKIPNII